MYWSVPPPVEGTIDEYAATSCNPSDRHFTSPVFLSRLAIVPLFPPGVQINRSPSIRTDSAYPQLGMLPPKSATRFFDQTFFPSLKVRQTRSPLAPRT